MIYFISDTHFGHENILSLCKRPFATVEEMDAALIANWNGRVKGSDIVYILGDLCYRTPNAEAIISSLAGKKRLIVGNHDSGFLTNCKVERYFESIEPFAEISDGTRALTLCHYPLLTWKHEKRSYMIHGHIHANTDMDFWPLLVKRERVLNAGADINGFTPVTFEELLENNRRFKAAHSPAER